MKKIISKLLLLAVCLFSTSLLCGALNTPSKNLFFLKDDTGSTGEVNLNYGYIDTGYDVEVSDINGDPITSTMYYSLYVYAKPGWVNINDVTNFILVLDDYCSNKKYYKLNSYDKVNNPLSISNYGCYTIYDSEKFKSEISTYRELKISTSNVFDITSSLTYKLHYGENSQLCTSGEINIYMSGDTFLFINGTYGGDYYYDYVTYTNYNGEVKTDNSYVLPKGTCFSMDISYYEFYTTYPDLIFSKCVSGDYPVISDFVLLYYKPIISAIEHYKSGYYTLPLEVEKLMISSTDITILMNATEGVTAYICSYVINKDGSVALTVEAISVTTDGETERLSPYLLASRDITMSADVKTNEIVFSEFPELV